MLIVSKTALATVNSKGVVGEGRIGDEDMYLRLHNVGPNPDPDPEAKTRDREYGVSQPSVRFPPVRSSIILS